MHDAVELKQVPEQPMAVVRGSATMATLPSRIRELFDQFYAGFKSKGELNIVFYPGDVAGEFEIACGVQIEHGGNASTPAGRRRDHRLYGTVRPNETRPSRYSPMGA